MTSSIRAIARLALALAVLLLVTRTWFIVHRAFDVDELEHAHAAWSVSQGQVPYRDFFEHHTPALYLLSAPLFARLTSNVDPQSAIALLRVSRAVMWVLMAASVALAFRLGTLWRDRLTGALTAAFLMTSVQFADAMIEFRPDVAAVLCVLVALNCAMPDRHGTPRSWRQIMVGGVAFGTALMFTPKAIFAAPGLVIAAAACRPARSLASFAAGAALPVAIVVAWFVAHGAAGPLFEDTVAVNARLNADRTSPFPRLLTHIALHPALYVLGFAGMARALRAPRGLRHMILAATGWSLAAGVFIIGRTYDQYYALLLPVLSVFAADMAIDIGKRLQWRRPVAAAAVALMAAGAISAGTLAWSFRSNASQIADMEYVMQRTSPLDTVLSGVPGAGTFRPHAWFYFFLSGPFATDRDYADLLSALQTERIRPRLVVMDRRIVAMPAPVLAYIDAHYRRARGDIFERAEP